MAKIGDRFRALRGMNQGVECGDDVRIVGMDRDGRFYIWNETRAKRADGTWSMSLALENTWGELAPATVMLPSTSASPLDIVGTRWRRKSIGDEFRIISVTAVDGVHVGTSIRWLTGSHAGDDDSFSGVGGPVVRPDEYVRLEGGIAQPQAQAAGMLRGFSLAYSAQAQRGSMHMVSWNEEPSPARVARHDFSDRYCVAVMYAGAGHSPTRRCKDCGTLQVPGCGVVRCNADPEWRTRQDQVAREYTDTAWAAKPDVATPRYRMGPADAPNIGRGSLACDMYRVTQRR